MNVVASTGCDHAERVEVVSVVAVTADVNAEYVAAGCVVAVTADVYALTGTTQVTCTQVSPSSASLGSSGPTNSTYPAATTDDDGRAG